MDDKEHIAIAVATQRGWYRHQGDGCWMRDGIESELPSLDELAWLCVVELAREFYTLKWYEGEPDFGVFDETDPNQEREFIKGEDPALVVCKAWLKVFHSETSRPESLEG